MEKALKVNDIKCDTPLSESCRILFILQSFDTKAKKQMCLAGLIQTSPTCASMHQALSRTCTSTLGKRTAMSLIVITDICLWDFLNYTFDRNRTEVNIHLTFIVKYQLNACQQCKGWRGDRGRLRVKISMTLHKTYAAMEHEWSLYRDTNLTVNAYLRSYEEQLFLNVMNTSADDSKSHTREYICIISLSRIVCPTIICNRRKWRPTSKNTSSL